MLKESQNVDLYNKLKQRRVEIRREYQNRPQLIINFHQKSDTKDKNLQNALDMITDVKSKSNDLESKMKHLESKWKFKAHTTAQK